MKTDTPTISPPDSLPDDLLPLWHIATAGPCPPGMLHLRREAFLALMRLRDVRTAIDRDGVVIASKRSKIARPNPLVSLEITLRRQVERLWDRAGLLRYFETASHSTSTESENHE